MTLTFTWFLQELAATLRNPRAGLRQIFALKPDQRTAWEALLLTVVVSVLLVEVLAMIMHGRADVFGSGFGSPFVQGVFQAVVLTATILMIFAVGKRAGGHGTLTESIILMVWLQSVMIAAQVVQLFVSLAVPFMAVPVGYAAMVLFFWLLTNFIAELHGFLSAWRVFVGILAVLLAVAVVMSILFAMLGVQIPGAV